jgi:hypothetical protein
VSPQVREAACAGSSARVVIPSLVKMWERCTLTVPGAMKSRWTWPRSAGPRSRGLATTRRPDGSDIGDTRGIVPPTGQL